MNRIGTFTFRLSREERKMIEALALRLQRSQSDAVRFVVVNAARELEKVDMQKSETEAGNDRRRAS